MVKQQKSFFLAVFFAAFSGFTIEEEQVVKKPLPIGADIYLGQSVGAKAPLKNDQEAYVATNIYAYPYYKSAPFWGDRQIKLFTELYTGLDWMSEGNPFVGDINKKYSFGDIKIRTELMKALKFSDLGLTITPAFEIETPVSKNARKANRIAGLGGYVTFAWTKWGFFVSWRPTVIGYVHSETFKSGECDATSSAADKLYGNTCKLPGRQTMVLLKNSLYMGYTYNEHTVTIGTRINHSFLRKPNQGERPGPSNADIMESSIAFLEYGYALPTEKPLSLMAGFYSSQDTYAARDGYRIPFFNLAEPKKNETEFYVAMNLSL